MNSTTETGVLVYTCLHPRKIYSFGQPEIYFSSTIPVCVINIILLIFTVLGNVTVILAYYRNKSLQTVANMLLITLAISDAVIGLVVQPLFITILIRDMLDLTPSCLLSLLSSISNKYCAGVSMMTLSLVISSERYLAIVHPFKHRRLVTKSRIKVVICLLWSLLFLINCILFLGINYKVYYLVLSALILVGGIITGFACHGILKKWRRSHKRHISIDSATRGSASAVALLERKNFNIAKTMFYIMGAIVLCYTPVLGALVYVQIKGLNRVYLKYLYPNVVTLVYLNSLLNPIIYCLRNRSFTRVILKMIGFHHRHELETPRRGRCYTIEQPLSLQQNVTP